MTSVFRNIIFLVKDYKETGQCPKVGVVVDAKGRNLVVSGINAVVAADKVGKVKVEVLDAKTLPIDKFPQKSVLVMIYLLLRFKDLRRLQSKALAKRSRNFLILRRWKPFKKAIESSRRDLSNHDKIRKS